MWSTKVENEKKRLFASTLPDFVFFFNRVLNTSAVRQQTVSVNDFKLVGHCCFFRAFLFFGVINKKLRSL